MDGLREQLQQELDGVAEQQWRSSPLRGQPAAPPVRWLSAASLKPLREGPPLELGLSNEGRWLVVAADGSVVDVEATTDYLPLFSLLELSFEEARETLAKEFESRGLSERWLLVFPFEQLVAAALTGRSRFWPDLALRWVDKLRDSDLLSSALDFVHNMGLTQQQRHHARRLLSERRRQSKA